MHTICPHADMCSQAHTDATCIQHTHARMEVRSLICRPGYFVSTHARSKPNTYVYTHICTHVHIHMHTHLRTYARTQMRASTRIARMHFCILNLRVHKNTHAYILYKHTLNHARIKHTKVLISTHIQAEEHRQERNSKQIDYKMPLTLAQKLEQEVQRDRKILLS
jgi:hypothetical protein